jgi:hypothetical protein
MANADVADLFDRVITGDAVIVVSREGADLA